MNFSNILQSQRAFFNSQHTKPAAFRIQQLRKLLHIIEASENLLYEAIEKDFGKSRFDTFTTELSFVKNEITYFIKKLPKFTQPKRVATNLANLPGSSKIHYDPLGCTLVIGAWNYPIQLTLLPLVASMAAGNTVLLKPSELAPHVSAVLEKLINDNFDQSYIHVIEGDAEITRQILEERFDKIFFTGSTRVGKIVYQAAAKHLTPVTLELGGKSPVIVTKNANLKVAAKRIIWGKFINAGQTCVAPDYLLVEESIAQEFINILSQQLETNKYDVTSPHYTKIINHNHFDRLVKLINEEKIIFGGTSNRDKRFIEPTILYPINWEDRVMEEEIFGPILPILTFHDYSLIIQEISEREKPLSAYLFSNDDTEQEQFTTHLSFGGGCINDVLMHLSNSHLPFGGVGQSGLGNYHGKYSFKTFSHAKSVLKKATWGEPNIKYPPYTENKLAIIKKLL